MTPTQLAITLPLATFATLLTVVACGPTGGNYVPVEVQRGSGKTQAFNACAHELRSGKVVKVAAQDKIVQVCVADTEAEAIAEAGAASAKKKPTYKMVDKPVKYQISRIDDVIQVKVDIDFEIPQGMSEDEKTLLGGVLKGCTDKIANKIQGTSGTSKNAVSLNSEITFSLGETPTTDENNVQAKLVRASDDSLALADWPESTRLLMKLSRLPYDKAQKEKAYVEANIPFCANLAKLVGHSLGLNEEGADRCGSKSSRMSQRPGFMKAASEESAQEFFSSAKLSSDELRLILAPACKSFSGK